MGPKARTGLGPLPIDIRQSELYNIALKQQD